MNETTPTTITRDDDDWGGYPIAPKPPKKKPRQMTRNGFRNPNSLEDVDILAAIDHARETGACPEEARLKGKGHDARLRLSGGIMDRVSEMLTDYIPYDVVSVGGGRGKKGTKHYVFPAATLKSIAAFLHLNPAHIIEVE